MLSGVTNCSSGAQSCLPVSTLQRHLKCFQLSMWFGKLWGSLWDLGSGFLGMFLKPVWDREPRRTDSAYGLTIPVCDGVKGLQVPEVQGVCLAVGCPCSCEGVLSADEVCRGAEFIQSPQKILGAAQYSRRLGRALWEFWVVIDVCKFVFQQQLNSDIQPWHSWEMLANHNKSDTSFLEFGPPFPSNAAAFCLLH